MRDFIDLERDLERAFQELSLAEGRIKELEYDNNKLRSELAEAEEVLAFIAGDSDETDTRERARAYLDKKCHAPEEGA